MRFNWNVSDNDGFHCVWGKVLLLQTLDFFFICLSGEKGLFKITFCKIVRSLLEVVDFFSCA